MQNNEPLWLEVAQVTAINQVQVESTGENYALLFSDKLESALYRPYQQFAYGGVDDVLLLTVYTMEAIAKAHAFEQGNKRTAFAAGSLFLENNGYLLKRPDGEEFAQAFVALVTNEITPEDFALYLEDHVVEDDLSAAVDELSEILAREAADPFDPFIT